MSELASRQVAWWPVHEYVIEHLAEQSDWPLIGTPEWCALPDDDPRKMASVLDAAQHYALYLDGKGEALAEASTAVSTAQDWNIFSTNNIQRESLYVERPWLRRIPA